MGDHTPPDLSGHLTRIEREDHTAWYSSDGRWVVVSQQDFDALVDHASPSDRPHPVDMGPELGHMLGRLGSGTLSADDDITEEVPTVAAPGHMPEPVKEPITPSRPSQPPSTPRLSRKRDKTPLLLQAVVVIACMVLVLAFGITIGTELTRRGAPEAPQDHLSGTTTISVRPSAASTSPSRAPAPTAPIAVATPNVRSVSTPAPRAIPPPAPAATQTPIATPPPVAAATPTLAPTPKATPRSQKPAWQQHVDAGWNYVEKNPASAAEHFRKALAIRPSNADANYGYGYALLKLGRQEAATTHLCAARIGGVSIQREIAGLLAEHRLTCP